MANNRKNIVITGATGVIGSVLTKGLAKHFDITPLSRQGCDLTKFDEVVNKIPNNTDVIIHLAWDKKPIYENGKMNNDNILMTLNVFEVAVAKQVKRVILASSVHVNEYRNAGGPTGGGPRQRAVISNDVRALVGTKEGQAPHYNNEDSPTSIYGATKLYFEALGKYYAEYHNLDVVAIRFGGVNQQNSPTAVTEIDYKKIFLSHEDLVKIVTQFIEKDLGEAKYQCIYAIS